ncbi:sigma-70 family RNA polymerase sigma factor [Halobacillus fulvus]|nr:sigma-70 family RNA polymerase sigma factor [Halobacillus fulvus]
MKKNQPTYADVEKLVYALLKKWRSFEFYEDLIQEAYIIFSHCERKYDPQKAKFSTYFSYKFSHHIQTYFRKEQLYDLTLKKLTPTLSAPHQEELDERLLLLDVHRSLTPFESKVCHLYYQGYKLSPILSMTDVSSSTIKRTRHILRDKICL